MYNVVCIAFKKKKNLSAIKLFKPNRYYFIHHHLYSRGGLCFIPHFERVVTWPFFATLTTTSVDSGAVDARCVVDVRDGERRRSGRIAKAAAVAAAAGIFREFHPVVVDDDDVCIGVGACIGVVCNDDGGKARRYALAHAKSVGKTYVPKKYGARTSAMSDDRTMNDRTS